MSLTLTSPAAGLPSFTLVSAATLKPLQVALRQALNYLNFLISDPIHAAAIYRSGILLQVPRPERYAIHKLIIADRRRDGAGSLKASKDREQAAFLIEAMAEDRPDDLSQAYAAAMSVGPRWREHIEKTLKRLPEAARLLNNL